MTVFPGGIYINLCSTGVDRVVQAQVSFADYDNMNE